MLTKKHSLAVAICTAGLFAAATATAGMNGPYIGADLGYGYIHQSSVSGLTTSSAQSTGIAGRADAGFQFSPYFAVETGYTKYSNSIIKGFNTDLMNAKATIDSYAIDILVRASLPVSAGFSIFGKVGASYLREDTQANGQYTPAAIAANPSLAGSSYSGPTVTDSKVFPTLGIGAQLDLSNNFLADITWMHIQRLGDNTLANADFVGVGLTYNLG